MTNQRPGEAGSDQSEAGRLESESERGAGNISPSQPDPELGGRPACRGDIFVVCLAKDNCSSSKTQNILKVRSCVNTQPIRGLKCNGTANLNILNIF